MAEFTNFSREAKEIELEIERNGIALGIDWEDEEQVRALAKEALHYHLGGEHLSGATDEGRTLLTKVELFGLAGLMLKTMTESADVGVHTHGGTVWKLFGKALLEEQKLMPPAPPKAT